MYRDVNPFTEPMRQTDVSGSAEDRVLVSTAQKAATGSLLTSLAFDKMSLLWPSYLVERKRVATVSHQSPVYCTQLLFGSLAEASASAYPVLASVVLSFPSH